MFNFVKRDEPVLIWTGSVALDAMLTVPHHSLALVLVPGFSHARENDGARAYVSALLHARYATLVADVLTPDEQQIDTRTGHFRVDTKLLAGRIRKLIEWAEHDPVTRDLPIAIFAGKATAAAAVAAASEAHLFAMALHGVRFENVGEGLQDVEAPTLFLFERAPTYAQRQELANLPFASSTMTMPAFAPAVEHDALHDMIVEATLEWFQAYVPKFAET